MNTNQKKSGLAIKSNLKAGGFHPPHEAPKTSAVTATAAAAGAETKPFHLGFHMEIRKH